MSPGSTEVERVESVAAWDATTDVLVVGLGCAGACAALEAAASGAEVRVLERAGGGGGTSALSGGLLYLGGGTPVQKACGFEDSPDEMFKFLMAASGPGPDEAKLRLFCDDSVEHFHWLVEQGVPFRAAFFPEPGMEPPGDEGLVYTGGEDAHPFDQIAKPAPRGHKPKAKAAAGGFLMERLLAAVAAQPIDVVYNTLCEALVVDADGRVVGARTRCAGEPGYTRARRGVVLAAGGFVNDRDMLARHAPQLTRCNVKIGTEGDDGRGIRMGQAAGAATLRMEAGEVAIPLTPPRRLMRGVLVNGSGQRFINEDTYYGRVGQETLYHQEGVAYLIVDDAIYERNRAGMEARFVGETVAELESEIGLPNGTLQATMALYNAHAAEGRDPVFRKVSTLVTPLDQPPYAAIDCRVGHSIYATFTLGGLHTDVDGRVLDPEGETIPGLFAAGRTTSGVSAFGYSSGVSLADGTYFGRRAGRCAAGHD